MSGDMEFSMLSLDSYFVLCLVYQYYYDATTDALSSPTPPVPNHFEHPPADFPLLRFSDGEDNK